MNAAAAGRGTLHHGDQMLWYRHVQDVTATQAAPLVSTTIDDQRAQWTGVVGQCASRRRLLRPRTYALSAPGREAWVAEETSAPTEEWAASSALPSQPGSIAAMLLQQQQEQLPLRPRPPPVHRSAPSMPRSQSAASLPSNGALIDVPSPAPRNPPKRLAREMVAQQKRLEASVLGQSRHALAGTPAPCGGAVFGPRYGVAGPSNWSRGGVGNKAACANAGTGVGQGRRRYGQSAAAAHRLEASQSGLARSATLHAPMDLFKEQVCVAAQNIMQGV
jgi:hypothetical protein